jgi:hypothetical protein
MGKILREVAIAVLERGAIQRSLGLEGAYVLETTEGNCEVFFPRSTGVSNVNGIERRI